MFINSFDYHPPTGGSQINKCLQPPMSSTFFPWPGNQAVNVKQLNPNSVFS